MAIWGPAIVVNRDLFFGISQRLYVDKIEAINNFLISRCERLAYQYARLDDLWHTTSLKYSFEYARVFLKKILSSCPTVESSVPDFAFFRQSMVKFTSSTSLLSPILGEPYQQCTLSTYWWHWVFTKTYSCSEKFFFFTLANQFCCILLSLVNLSMP